MQSVPRNKTMVFDLSRNEKKRLSRGPGNNRSIVYGTVSSSKHIFELNLLLIFFKKSSSGYKIECKKLYFTDQQNRTFYQL